MSTTFEEDFIDFISQRIGTAHSTMLKENTEQGRQYNYYSEQYSRLEKDIYERMGASEEAFNLLFDLADARNLSIGIELDVAYIQGLRDGFSLMKIIKEGITWPASRCKDERGEAEGA